MTKSYVKGCNCKHCKAAKVRYNLVRKMANRRIRRTKKSGELPNIEGFGYPG